VISICGTLASKISSDKKPKILAALITLGGVGLIIGFSIDDMHRLISLMGLLFFVFGCQDSRRRIGDLHIVWNFCVSSLRDQRDFGAGGVDYR